MKMTVCSITYHRIRKFETDNPIHKFLGGIVIQPIKEKGLDTTEP
jgi:hypothetical protein